ncbi:T9SS type A sorting domain-containing protein [Fulvivirga maritima]|uniref:lamin tail domain-containing protein n=1 Tax=Fulvivirga maritima TaxID=2904247 RepID=UPI001F31503C|nr:T9SS type A sorting domain-containing protein [Fulvivirga maritima]UII25209.1 T9SS type A sorting domain-containing protein [Fulvivirga maritima]
MRKFYLSQLLLLTFLFVVSSSAWSQGIFINEIHYDNAGADTEEGVEIAGPAGSDLTGWSLVFYNGNGGAAYSTQSLTGTLPNQDNGYGTLFFYETGLQNGSPDGIALIDASSNVVQFLSYEGSFMAVGGLADGLTSTDIGVDEASSTPVGYSLQLGGTGSVYSDFSWQSAQASTYAAINTGQSFGGTPPTPVVTVLINEIDADTEGTDTAEFIELYDGGVGNTSLDSLVVVLFNGSNDLSYQAYDLEGYSTDANGYFVLGNAGVNNVEITFGSNTLQNGADAVALYKANAADFPSGTAITSTGLIDAIVYDTNDADDTELLTLLNADEPQVNEDGEGDKDFHSLQRFPNGEGGLRNTSTYVAALPTPGAANTSITEAVTLIINEVDADTPGSDQEEFVELYDGGVGNVALDGFVVVFFNGNGDASYNAFDLAGYTTNADGYFVLGNAAVANVDLVFSNNGLQNGADAVALYQGTAADFPSGTLVTTTNLVDAVVYDTDDSDDAELLVLLNSGEPQLNENEGGDKDNESLQRMPNGSGGARNTSAYVTAAPTPGAENGGILPPGELQTIAEARALPLGTSVTVKGIITVSDQLAGPAYIQDSTGGIAIFDAAVHGNGVFNIGDSIEVSGVTEAFNDQVQLGTVSNVMDFGPATNPIVPQQVTLSELSAHPGELVTVVNTTFPNPGDILFGNSNYALSDASGSGELRIDADVQELVGYEQPEACSAITGVVGRYQAVYQLLPRQVSDLPCASPYVPDGEDLEIPRESTFDVAAWNIEWFGDEGNAPAADAVQKDSVKAILLALDADIIAVEEIVDTVLFDQMVSEMAGYDYFLSSYVSNPGQYDNSQKVGFIYNTSTVVPDFDASRALLSTIHPLYNGGDDSYLVGYPDARDRFWASGRLPFMLEADVTIEGVTEKINMLVVHARANSSSDAQSRYDMRKYDVEVLKDSLDAYYSDANLIMLGDFNDDLDVTVADVSTTVSTYEEYIADTAEYKLLTLSLSNQGLRTYVFYENVIDHIIASDEAAEYFLEGSARVGYQFYDSDYAYNTSDHLPVTARFQFADEVVENNFTVASITSFNQGNRANGWPVSFIRSNPDKALGEPLENFYYNFVSLGFSGEIVLELDNYMYDLEGDDFRVYESSFGPLELPCFIYPEKAEVFVSEDGSEFYSVGSTCQNGDFDLATSGLQKAKYIKVKDVTKKNIFLGLADGYDLDGIYNLHQPSNGGRKIADHQNYVPNEDGGLEVEVYPNPFAGAITINASSLESKEVEVSVTDIMGRQVMAEPFSLEMGQSSLRLELGELPKGVYILRIIGNDDSEILKRTVVKDQ